VPILKALPVAVLLFTGVQNLPWDLSRFKKSLRLIQEGADGKKEGMQRGYIPSSCLKLA
jgi:hypothetical protein